MKTFIRFVLVVSLIITPVALFALDLRVGEQAGTAQGERLNGDVYIAGGGVQSSGTITGDLVAVGGIILINGGVSGDLITGGGNVTLIGSVGDDVRIGGGNLVVSSKIGGDLVIGGGQVQITGEGIGGDLLMGSGVARIDAPIKGNILIGGGEVYLNAPVTGNVKFHGDRLTLGPRANIGGDLTYRAKKEAIKEDGAVVQGNTVYESWNASKKKYRGVENAFVSIFMIGKFFATFIVSLLLGLIFRRYSKELVHTATARPIKEIFRGFVTLAALPIASSIFFMTIIGIFFGILGIISFIALLVFGIIASPIVLGSFVDKWLFKKSEYEISWRTILFGAILSTLLGALPVIGWIILCGFMLLTIGSALSIKWTILKEWR